MRELQSARLDEVGPPGSGRPAVGRFIDDRVVRSDVEH
jgi:hypothetical protein